MEVQIRKLCAFNLKKTHDIIVMMHIQCGISKGDDDAEGGEGGGMLSAAGKHA